MPSKRNTPVDFQRVVLGEDLPRQGKAKPGEVRQGKARQARQGKARQGKVRQGKARQGKAARRGEAGQAPPQTAKGSRGQELCLACSWGSQLQKPGFKEYV